MFLLLGCWTVQAAKVTATIDAWNKASLQGDSAAMKVQYSTTTRSGTRITADNSAQFTLSGLPRCTLNTITLYIRSNASAGAGMVMMRVADRTWLAANENYNQWPGIDAYSTTALPLSCLSKALEVRYGSVLSIQIECTTNSLYLEKVEVDYTLSPPVAHTVTLQWLAQDGSARIRQLPEEEALSGVELPSVGAQDSVLDHAGETWYWLGWCEQEIASQSTSPVYWQTNDWYGPEDDCTLYALYTNTPRQEIGQDSSFVSGEYALIRIEEAGLTPVTYAMKGNWKSGKIDLPSVPLQKKNQHQWVWMLSQLEDAYRYQLTFAADSVTIYHPHSQSGIGYNKSSGGNNSRKWAWRKTQKGTIGLFGNTSSNATLSISYNEYQQCYFAEYKDEPFLPSYPYWYLFPVASVPSSAETLFTTLSTSAGQSLIPHQSAHPTKWMDPQGRIIIEYNHYKFTVKGEQL